MTAVVHDLDDLVARVAAHDPVRQRVRGNGFHAGVAVVLTDAGDEPALLVIQRATRSGDPWSGHAALPGGKREHQDVDLEATARRETAEEVGVVLPSEPVGRLDDVGGRVHSNVVTPVVFRIDDRPPLTLESAEVAAASWVPLRVLVDPDFAGRHPTRMGPFPAWLVDDLVIWGLTHRVLSNLVEVGGLTR